MRPRVFPAEDSATGRPFVSESQRFNEAAGIPRGRHAMDLLPMLDVIVLQ